MKSRQFCSVCKSWLDMEVVPTNDGDEDDGVIWFRCPQCQGFLPKLSGADRVEPEATVSEGDAQEAPVSGGEDSADAGMPWDSPADMMAEHQATAAAEAKVSPFLPEDQGAEQPSVGLPDLEAEVPELEEESDKESGAETSEPAEPVHEYAAMLAEADTAEATPYRPWGNYQVGQCVHHLAWEDCGVVVAKEELPGGRKVVKCFFEDAGVVHLIEQAPR